MEEIVNFSRILSSKTVKPQLPTEAKKIKVCIYIMQIWTYHWAEYFNYNKVLSTFLKNNDAKLLFMTAKIIILNFDYKPHDDIQICNLE